MMNGVTDATPQLKLKPSIAKPTKITPQYILPKLRIAPFAKENALAFHQDPPGLPSLRISNVQGSVELNSNKATNSYKQLNIRSDLTQQSRPSNGGSSGMQMRLKNTPLRKTPMPELVSSDIPKQYSASETDYNSYKHASIMNSKKAKKRALREAKMSAEMHKKRKRQLIDYGWPDTQSNHADMNDYFDDDDEDEEEEENMAHETSFRPKLTAAEDKSFSFDKVFFGQLLKEFQNSLFNNQREMINVFYINQMNLIRNDHEFQMKQDTLMLKAFKRQSEHFWTTARDFMGMNKNNSSCNTTADVKVCKEQCTQTPKALDDAVKINKINNEQQTLLSMKMAGS